MNNEERSFKRFDLSGLLPASLLQSIVINAACPYMFYQLLISHLSNIPALLVALLFPLGSLTISLYQKRSLDLIGIGAIFIIITNLITSSFDNQPQLFLLKNAVLIGLLGIALLFSTLLSKPILFYADRFFSTNNEPTYIDVYNGYWWKKAEYRSMIKMINVVWGCSQLCAACIIVALFLTRPIQQVIFLTPLIEGGIIALIFMWTLYYKNLCTQRLTAEEDRVSDTNEE